MNKAKKKKSSSSLVGLIGALFVVAIGLAIYLVWQSNSQGAGGSGIEFEKLPLRGDKNLLVNIETFPNDGQDHVSTGTLKYNTNPPTSGPHRPSAAPAGFYNEKPEAGLLVHSLEHGGIVIYFNPSRATEEEKNSLRAFTKANTGMWASVLAIPTSEYEVPFILTAWTKIMKLEKYDAKVVQAFIAEYVGRGPEKPVR
jgi:hypothetical protein